VLNNSSLLDSRPSRVSQAAPQPKADSGTAPQAAAASAKAAQIRSQDDTKQSQQSPNFVRGGGPALVDPSSEKYTLMPESLRRKTVFHRSSHVRNLLMSSFTAAAATSARRPTSAPRTRAAPVATASIRPQTPTKGSASAAPPTPSRNASSDTPVFYERMIAWVNKRDMDAEEKGADLRRMRQMGALSNRSSTI